MRKKKGTKSPRKIPMKKIVKPRKGAAPKTRNHGTFTESQFWSFIRSCLRNKSRWWKPIQEAKKAARRAYKGPNKRQQWEYKCDICKEFFMEKFVEVDHLIPAGSLRCSDDLKGFIERLFCEIEHLRVLCKKCHLTITKEAKDGKE